MAIIYPLSMPSTKMAVIEFTALDAVAYSASPFTFAGQAQAWPGQMLRLDVTLPPMLRDVAEEWVAFLISLRGQYGTFLIGDPAGAIPRGGAAGAPLVMGGNQTGGSLTLSGATASQTGWIKAGDYIQLGAAGTATLHKALADADSDGSGVVQVDIWPHLRASPVHNSVVVLQDTVGQFRLASNDRKWSIRGAQKYGMSFSAIEAV